MVRSVRFLIGLVAALALLALVGDWALLRMTRKWFERDLELRSRLAVASAGAAIPESWTPRNERLARTLLDIARDERVMGAAACTDEGLLLAATPQYPRAISCRDVMGQVRAAGSPEVWGSATTHEGAQVHLNVVRVERVAPSGAIVLVQDMSFVARRETAARVFLLAAFFVLALMASLVTIVAARFAWKRWALDLQRALSGEAPREMRPLVRDVRALMERLQAEAALEARGGSWSPARLKQVLTERLVGERIVILANREPYIHERTPEGVRVLHPASGLVTALEPVMKACSGVWVAHGSGSADREVVDAHDRIRVPPGEESYLLRRVWLTEEQENGYYYGFANEGLWPLCHVAHERPQFRAEDWHAYQEVNRKFADAVCAEVKSDDPIVLVQDYHFALAPRMIRERLPRATLITFWHIPWPNAERIGICPWREEILSGLLGSSIVGFHTQQHCNNFIDSVDAFMESRIDREERAVVQRARKTLVRPYPISIAWPAPRLEHVPPVAQCASEVRRELGLAPDALVGVGVDRLDYTKGIEERLQAVDHLLAQHPALRGRFTFVQLAAPSRTKIPRYRELNDRVEAQARLVNERWGTADYRPVILLRAHHEPETVLRYYRAANLCYVSSLHDGMNLVAKEFVAARDDEQGVLVLSQFTGAARDLTEALIVNPYDLEQAAEALALALAMPPDEQRERMQSMRRLVAEFNVYRWAGRMLVDAAELRRRERLGGRLSHVVVPPAVHT